MCISVTTRFSMKDGELEGFIIHEFNGFPFLSIHPKGI